MFPVTGKSSASFFSPAVRRFCPSFAELFQRYVRTRVREAYPHKSTLSPQLRRELIEKEMAYAEKPHYVVDGINDPGTPLHQKTVDSIVREVKKYIQEAKKD